MTALLLYKPFTTRRIPSLTADSPKLITNPNFNPVNLRYVNVWDTNRSFNLAAALHSTITFLSTIRSTLRGADKR